MEVSQTALLTKYSHDESERLWRFIQVSARQPDLKAAVELNHSDNTWWPISISDWRVRMIVAGWSARVSYAMVGTYGRVVAAADEIGYDTLVTMSDEQLMSLIGPIGLHHARIRYLRSIAKFIERHDDGAGGLLTRDADSVIDTFATEVDYASYKIAQCATMYSRGYHSGIIPVDSGMVQKLAPCLGWSFSRGSIAHEQMRNLLQSCVEDSAERYVDLARSLSYEVTLPSETAPTWWVHLQLIYFKRLYCNRPADRLCVKRPVCARLLDCECAIWDD